MLIFRRCLEEVVRIGNNISITVISLDGGSVRLGIEAPPEVPVHRGEVYAAIHADGRSFKDPGRRLKSEGLGIRD